MKATSSNSPIHKLTERLKARFPSALIDLDPPAEASGIWFLDVKVGKHTVSAQWQRGKGIGITSSADGSYGEGAHELSHRTEAAFDRIVQLLLARGRTKAPEPIGLGEVRRLQRVSQEKLAKTLRIKQSSVSKLEQRDDLLLSSLRALIEGLGGQLHVRASFPDGRSCLLNIPATKAKR
jgi:DNA-binding transcriptional regulator YiaG